MFGVPAACGSPLSDAAIRQWIGVYDPPHLSPAIKNAVEHADFLVTLGAVFPNGYASLVQNAFGRMVEIYAGRS